jgi:hypothetical protein
LFLKGNVADATTILETFVRRNLQQPVPEEPDESGSRVNQAYTKTYLHDLISEAAKSAGLREPFPLDVDSWIPETLDSGGGAFLTPSPSPTWAAPPGFSANVFLRQGSRSKA